MARDNTIVGVGGRDHRRGILHSAFDVVIRGVLQQGREFFRDIGTAKVIRPETAGRELVESQHVHDADAWQAGSVEIRSLSHTGSHEQTAVAATLNGQLL